MSTLQQLRKEATNASAYLDLCIRANRSIEKGKKKQVAAFLELLNFKVHMGKEISAILTDEYHKGTNLISIERISQLTNLSRTDLLEVLPELLTHHQNGYFKLETLNQLTY